jgi:hypothetical protein
MNHALIEIPQHGGYLCEACGVRIACLELVAICGPDWLRNLSIIPGCPGPREEKPWSSPAAMVELIHQLLDDRDPLTGEPREPIITREEAMKLLDLAAADEGIRFPKGGVKPGAPVLDEATAFDDVIAAWKVPPSTLSLGPLEVRTSTVIPPGEFRLFPLEPKPFDDRIFAEAIESIRKDLCERQEKLRRVFFAGADFAKPDEEQPLIVTFPQAKRLDKLAASAIRFDKTCAGCGIRLPGGFKSDVCKPCAESQAGPGPYPCGGCVCNIPSPTAICQRCGYCNDVCCHPHHSTPTRSVAPRRCPGCGVPPGAQHFSYCPQRPPTAPKASGASIAQQLYGDRCAAPSGPDAPTKAPDADACICFMSRSRNCKATKHWGES